MRNKLLKVKYTLTLLLLILLILVSFPLKLFAQSRSDISNFVTQFYESFLSRSPDSEGLDKWVNDLSSGSKTGAEVVYGFVFSKEFKDRKLSNADFLTVLYRTFFDREPDSNGFNYWLNLLNEGKNREYILSGFTNSTEFVNLCRKYGIEAGYLKGAPKAKEVFAANSITDTIVYADYYPWYDDANWKRGHSNAPYLGLYDSLDPRVLSQHSAWANEYGIDVFKVGYVPQLDDNITRGILNTDLGNTKICLMYDPLVRFITLGKGRPPYNFNDPEIYNTFVNDMNHIADVYFSNPNYFNINGRPVLWIYITRDMTGNWKNAIKEARKNMNDKGYDVYLVGDHIWWDYDYNGIELFDAIGIYSPYPAGPPDLGQFNKNVNVLYSRWYKVVLDAGKDFIPTGMFAYDDRCLIAERRPKPVLIGTKEEMEEMLKIVSQYLDTVNGAENLNQVSLMTFNENQEGSGVEPSQEWGYSRIELIPKYFGNN